MSMLSDFNNNNDEWRQLFYKLKKYGWQYLNKMVVKNISKRIQLKVFYNNNRVHKITLQRVDSSRPEQAKTLTFNIDNEKQNGLDKTCTFTDLLRGLEEIYYLARKENIKYVKDFLLQTDIKLTEEEKQKLIEICKSNNILNYEDISKYTNGLEDFEKLYDNACTDEQAWQAFFQKRLWVLGLTLQQQLLIPSRNSGNLHSELSTRNLLDGSLLTSGAVNYLTICEFKKHTAKLLEDEPYRERNGEIADSCYHITTEVSGGIAQVLQYKRNVEKELRQAINSKDGDYTGKNFEIMNPKCYLVIGKLKEFTENNGRKDCFELFRRNCKDVEIITYDEIYERMNFIVNNMIKKTITKN